MGVKGRGSGQAVAVPRIIDILPRRAMRRLSLRVRSNDFGAGSHSLQHYSCTLKLATQLVDRRERGQVRRGGGGDWHHA